MRQLLLSLSILFLCALFALNKSTPANITQLIVTIPQLSNIDLKQSLEIDFINMPGVSKCESSHITKTMLMRYDDRRVSIGEIESIFHKWSCTPINYSYKKIY